MNIRSAKRIAFIIFVDRETLNVYRQAFFFFFSNSSFFKLFHVVSGSCELRGRVTFHHSLASLMFLDSFYFLKTCLLHSSSLCYVG